jgi:integrase
MGQKVPPGLIKRGEIWYIRKAIAGNKIQESTGTRDLKEAERFLAHRIDQIRNAEIYGIRPKRTFREAATRYLDEENKASMRCEATQLKMLDPFIGDLSLEAVHMGSLQAFIKHRKAQGVKTRTVNYGLQVVRHILNLAAGEWMDDRGMTWLRHSPKIKLLRETDKKEPYPLSWDEQERLFHELPPHLRNMALFAVNTGTREQEVCGLTWNMEVVVPELDTSVFIIPAHRVKNRQDRLVILNRVAQAVIKEQRRRHPTHVFVYGGRPVGSMYNTAWQSARKRAGLPQVRVHDLKHTFGRRLRASGVSFEDRQDLLGHKSSRITTHYSEPELINLIQASERVCPGDRSKMGTTIILRKQLRHLTAV